MARLIFCFFAEDTDIFPGGSLFTRTVEQMSERDSSNTHEVISTLFLAMNTKAEERAVAGVPRWAVRVSVCKRWVVLWEPGRAALQQAGAFLSAAYRRFRLEDGLIQTFSDP